MAVNVAEVLGKELQHELECFKDQEITSGKWFYVRPEDNRLSLYDKPTTVWGYICEWFSRIFNPDKYQKLERKVTELTQKINTFLQIESDNAVLFLYTQTLTLNALFNAIFKLRQCGRIQSFSLDSYKHIKELLEIRNKRQVHFLTVKNNTKQDVSLSVGERSGKLLVENVLNKGKTSNYRMEGVMPNCDWEVAVNHQAKPLNCGFAVGQYIINLDSDKIRFEFGPLRTQVFEASSEKVSSMQQLQVDFSEGQPDIQKIGEGSHLLKVENRSEKRVWVEVVVKGGVNQFLLKPFFLEKKKGEQINFEDVNSLYERITEGLQHVDSILQSEFSYTVRFVQYEPMTLIAV